MTKLMNSSVARATRSKSVATVGKNSVVRRPVKAQGQFLEAAAHVLLEALPLAAVAVEFQRDVQRGRVPFKALLLCALLAI